MNLSGQTRPFRSGVWCGLAGRGDRDGIAGSISGEVLGRASRVCVDQARADTDRGVIP